MVSLVCDSSDEANLGCRLLCKKTSVGWARVHQATAHNVTNFDELSPTPSSFTLTGWSVREKKVEKMDVRHL